VAWTAFLQEFLDPCIVIFEDIDAFACNRFEQGSSVFADFLQMLSGLTERREQGGGRHDQPSGGAG